MKNLALFLLIILLFACSTISAQTTEFTYQGSLKNGGVPANGNYDFVVGLFDAEAGGTQLSATHFRSNVSVINGTFSFKLDFGDLYPGANRYLDIGVRQSGGGAFTPLTPRQAITSLPYSVKSLNTDRLGGVAANQYVTASSANSSYIQNTTSQQNANFNISGNGTLGGTLVINRDGDLAANNGQIKLMDPDNLSRGLILGHEQTMAGTFSFIQSAPDPSGFNSNLAIQANGGNVGIGTSAPTYKLQVDGGYNAGLRVLTSLVGGTVASFGGTGDFVIDTVGTAGGRITVKQNGNVGIGTNSPTYKFQVNDASNTGLRVLTNTAGGTVASFGGNGDFVIDTASNAGGRFTVKESGNIGIGTNAPTNKLQVNDASNTGLRILTSTPGGTVASFGGLGAFVIDTVSTVGGRFTVQESGNVGIGTNSPTATFEVRVGGTTLADAWTTRSSARYKSNIQTIPFALNKVLQLRGVAFDYKDTRKPSVGFIAEEVGQVLPEVVEYEANGRDAKGLDYNKLTPVVVEAIKEQQKEIQAQQLIVKQQQVQIQQQRKQIESLTKVLCAINSKADICQ